MSDTIPNPYAQGLKRDERNRQLRVYWSHHVNVFRQSDLTQKEFCSRHGLDYSKFKNWLQRLKADEATTFNNFIPAQVKDTSEPSLSEAENAICLNQLLEGSPGPSPDLHLTLPKGLTIIIPKGFDSSTLRRAVKALTS